MNGGVFWVEVSNSKKVAEKELRHAPKPSFVLRVAKLIGFFNPKPYSNPNVLPKKTGGILFCFDLHLLCM